MFKLYYYILLYYILNLGLVRSLVGDDSCFAERSLSTLNGISQEEEPLFHETLSKLKSNPFTLAVRYCLGRDGSASSQNFVKCLASHNSCPSPWYSNINWQFCLCNTVHCIFNGCLSHWIRTSDLFNTECFSHCYQDSADCIFKQTGKFPFSINNK